MLMNQVVSKYFSGEIVMDDSDFQEKKKCISAPKKVTKSRINKKLPKRTKGQNDIRVLIKKKENEVVTYSKEFNKVCMQTGVDIDSEELQLAIALSKSLYEVEPNSYAKNTKFVTSQQRTLKIKTTLQEYGFQIPKTKISKDTNRIKKYRKQYKLLLLSHAEKQQIISDKYSEVLAVNIHKSPVKVSEQSVPYTLTSHDKQLYYKTTNISYESIKNNNVYYVKDLFLKATTKPWLLRDWSEIPGRPLSPIVPVSDINFDDITCNQHDLDCILSGTVLTAQQVINKINSYIACNNNINIKNMEFNNKESIKANNMFLETDCNEKVIRCISPDLFDDSSSIEGTINAAHQTVVNNDKNQTIYMDLTECVNLNFVKADKHGVTKVQATHEINVTSRKSNDYMEITDCIVSSSKEENYENIDLTQNLNESYKHINNNLCQKENIEIMDLTQVPDEQLQLSSATKDIPSDNTIILLDFDQKPQQEKLSEPICDDDLYKAKQILKSVDKIEKNSPMHCLFNGTNKGNNDNFDTVVLDDEGRFNLNSKDNFQDQTLQKNNQDSNKFEDNCNAIKVCDNDMSSMSCNNTCNINYDYENNLHESEKFINEVHECPPYKIDLTQSSNSSNDDTNSVNLSTEPNTNYSNSLGKKDNISIDYDEIFDDIVRESKSQTSLKSIACEIEDENYLTDREYIHSNNDIASNLSRSTEDFEISDKEFNYSLNKCKQTTQPLKGISDIRNSNFQNNSSETDGHYVGIMNGTLDENNVNPFKEVLQSEELILNTEIASPIRVTKANINNVLQTPKNDEYIIKTNKVTPMLDYASMSSPERHKELEKYGLKPFKRKRAIQLLTYLYNQTHPIVETHDDDCQLPSKRQKKDDEGEQYNSPRKSSQTPKASFKSIPEVNKKNDLYAVTKEHPDIRNIECDTEDWVFQKREKAKVRSCRVPLHVAFHNYMSCRQGLMEAILRYDPVNIDIIHKGLVASGYRYNPKDLLKFMDKKCITVRTADNNSRK